jgi:hypothetical protein
MKKLILLLLLPLLFLIKPISAHAETQIPERPTNGIYDPKNYVTNKVSSKLAEFNSTSDTQIAVYIIDTLDGKNIDDQAKAIAKAWQIGYSDTNKGILIAIAIKDRKFRIETSNEASKSLTKTNIDSILSASKSYMRKEDYDGAVINMIDNIEKYTKVNNQPEKEKDGQGLFQFENNTQQSERKINPNVYEEYQQKETIRILKVMAVVGGIMGLIIGLPSAFDFMNKLSYKKRSKFTYKGPYKLTPKDSNFQPNKTWTDERTKNFWKNEYKNRSQFSYNGSDKLYPGDVYFVDNSSWTSTRIEEYKKKKEEELAKKLEEEKRQKEERLRRSQYNYQGEDKLYPNNVNFVSNDTWTTVLIANYLSDLKSQNHDDYHSSSHSSYDDYSSYSSSSYTSSYDSSSSWSSSDWGGGGFDGGGSSGDW